MKMKKVFDTLIVDFILAVCDIVLICTTHDFLRAHIPAPFGEAVYLALFIALILLGFIIYAKVSSLVKKEPLIISTDERPYRCTGKTVCDNPGCTLCNLSIADIKDEEK